MLVSASGTMVESAFKPGMDFTHYFVQQRSVGGFRQLLTAIVVLPQRISEFTSTAVHHAVTMTRERKTKANDNSIVCNNHYNSWYHMVKVPCPS